MSGSFWHGFFLGAASAVVLFTLTITAALRTISCWKKGE